MYNKISRVALSLLNIAGKAGMNMGKLILILVDEYENMDGWHKMTLRLPAAVGEYTYADMELLSSEGESVFLKNMDMKKLTVAGCSGSSADIIVPCVYCESVKDELRTVRAGETRCFETSGDYADSLPGSGRVIPYTMRYSLTVSLVGEK